MFLLLFLGYNAAWDREEEDSLKKVYARIMNDIALPVSPVELIHTTIGLSKPVTLDKLDKTLVSGSEVLLSSFWWAAGDEDRAFTQQGNLRGLNNLSRNIPLLSAGHEILNFLQESPDLQDALDMRFK